MSDPSTLPLQDYTATTPAKKAPTSNLGAALALAAEGLEVFPIWHCVDGVCACGNPTRGQVGKHPRCANGHLNATTDEEQIKSWWCAPDSTPPFAGLEWECHEFSNIGIRVPDGMIVVDVDPRNGGIETFDAIAHDTSRGFPATLTVLSGSGGLHLYYRVSGGMGYPKTLDALGLGKGIDLKQLGGYVLAPPSIHKSGGRYEWAEPRLPVVDAPAWLLELTTGPRKERTQRTRDRSKLSGGDLSEATIKNCEALIALLEEHYVEGAKHDIACAFGAYCRANGRSSELAEHVIGELPSIDPDARVADALTFYDDYGNTTGWHKLSEHLPEETMAELEKHITVSGTSAFIARRRERAARGAKEPQVKRSAFTPRAPASITIIPSANKRLKRKKPTGWVARTIALLEGTSK